MPVPLGVIAAQRTVTAVAWTPASLTNLFGWWDADDATTFTYSSGTVVSQWRDKSGGGHHLAQATVTHQPTRDATLNSKAGVTFTTNDAMDYDAGGDTIDISPWTFWAVIDLLPRVAADGRIMTTRRAAELSNDYESPNAIILWRNGTSDNVSAMSSGTASPTATGGSAPMIVGSRMSGSQVFARVGLTETSGTGATAPGNMRLVRVGAFMGYAGTPPLVAANQIDASIFEMFICNANVTTLEAVTYLQGKWGL